MVEKEKSNMKKLPNGITIFNACPHPTTFWQEGWDQIERVEVDEVINARIEEGTVGYINRCKLVQPRFVPTKRGEEIAESARHHWIHRRSPGIPRYCVGDDTSSGV